MVLPLQVTGLPNMVMVRLVLTSTAAGTALGFVAALASAVATDTKSSVEKAALVLTVLVPGPGRVKTPEPPAPAGLKLVAQETVLVSKPESTVVRIRLGRSTFGPAEKAVSTEPDGPISERLHVVPEFRATLVTIVPTFPDPVARIM